MRLSPDRWLVWLGELFVVSVYYFPTGLAGRLRANAAGVQSSCSSSSFTRMIS